MNTQSFEEQRLALLDSQWHELQLGDLFFYVMKKGNAYWTAFDYQSSSHPPLSSAMSAVTELPAALEIKEKIYLSEDSERLAMTLQLADKPYQVNPAADVKIAPKSRLILYVSTPLWLQLRLEEGGKVLVEYPTVHPRLSWVGPNTTEGGLCYSTRTSAPSVFADVKQYKHRALTALELINDGYEVLTIDRLSLPLNMLGLYHSQESGYWTESVRYRITPETGETTVVAAQKPPEELGDLIKISEARNTNKTGRFRTAMNLLMG
ncbi:MULTISPECIES: hypothetical protein [unclassified Neptuniibacter]|uniref:hypothetical protein n=1 Tax=unclassified Neptuniibacter TaxID=2630693 RepID=UPI000C531966|nr:MULTISPECIES: hypothetical protein [unclassified Neptuniibacter]MAY41895.1 hypothetical protein [Oceanospirillaceae bacterium]|tara:strand:- start:997 stop:1788 length:792 start_codon:yes stop_codon:yes gene_type:complete